jgi:hypothetical protein
MKLNHWAPFYATSFHFSLSRQNNVIKKKEVEMGARVDMKHKMMSAYRNIAPFGRKLRAGIRKCLVVSNVEESHSLTDVANANIYFGCCEGRRYITKSPLSNPSITHPCVPPAICVMSLGHCRSMGWGLSELCFCSRQITQLAT